MLPARPLERFVARPTHRIGKGEIGTGGCGFYGQRVRNEPPLASEFVTVHAFVQTFDLLVASAHGSKKNLKQCWTNRDERRGITAVVPYR